MMSQAREIVNQIIQDLSGREGLGDEWDQLDDDIKKEIERKWEKIVEDVIG